VGPHAAAALAFKGYAWAATLPVLLGWAQHQRVPVLDSDRLRIGIARRLPFVRLDLSAVQIRLGDGPALAGAMRASLLSGHLADVIDALHAATRVGRRVLWGSVAESIAALMLRLPSAEPAAAAVDLLEYLGAPVADLVEITDGPDGPAVRRRTCCLWFTGETGRGTYCTTCCVP
jgi:ferric iron reductase protein FhuF